MCLVHGGGVRGSGKSLARFSGSSNLGVEKQKFDILIDRALIRYRSVFEIASVERVCYLEQESALVYSNIKNHVLWAWSEFNGSAS